MDDDIRIIKNSTLGEEKIKLLDGAPIFDPDEHDMAIIDVFKLPSGEHVAVYDYDKLIDVQAEMFKEGEDPEDAQEMAQGWVECNTVRSVPYMGNRAPIIVCEPEKDEDGATVEEDPDVEYLELGSVRYVIVECSHELSSTKDIVTDTLPAPPDA